MTKTAYLVVFLLFIFLVFQKNITANIQALLLITEQFPQVSVKPLNLLTYQPKHEKIQLQNANGNEVIADIFYPSTRFAVRLSSPSKSRSGQVQRTYPAVILAMGVKTSEKDRPIILGFAQTMSRLGYVTIWPRLKVLDSGVSKMEQPQTFITAFKHLENNPRVDEKRISFVGFSVGSSIAIIAAANPLINNQVNSLVFFGGYYSVFDYLKSINTHTTTFANQVVPWEPAEGATTHVKEILETEKISLDDQETLGKINPAKDLKDFYAKIFILHEKGDNYVPYFESVKLKEALEKEGRKPAAYHLANLFEHVQPKKGIGIEVLQEFFKLYLFVEKVFENL